jgi:hypothetical protein
MRPVLRGLATLKDYRAPDAFSLEEVALMNDALDVYDENAWRMRQKQ